MVVSLVMGLLHRGVSGLIAKGLIGSLLIHIFGLMRVAHRISRILVFILMIILFLNILKLSLIGPLRNFIIILLVGCLGVVFPSTSVGACTIGILVVYHTHSVVLIFKVVKLQGIHTSFISNLFKYGQSLNNIFIYEVEFIYKWILGTNEPQLETLNVLLHDLSVTDVTFDLKLFIVFHLLYQFTHFLRVNELTSYSVWAVLIFMILLTKLCLIS